MPRLFSEHISVAYTADVVDDIMCSTRELLSFLERHEAVQFLEALQNDISAEVQWNEQAAARQASLRIEILETGVYSALDRIHTELNELEMERFLQAESVSSLHKSCTEYRDLLADRVLHLVELELADSERGNAPVPFALISMGSDGREEQTLITDQDYLIVYRDGGGEEADEYFREFSDLLVERMAEIGFKKCTGGIMPSNPTWRGSLSQWRRKLLSIVRYEYEDYAKNLMDLIVLSDARYVAGDAELANDLVDMIRGLEQDYFQVLWGMAKAATEMKLALGFLKRLWTEGSGEHKGEFNLKLLAWAPLVMRSEERRVG